MSKPERAKPTTEGGEKGGKDTWADAEKDSKGLKRDKREKKKGKGRQENKRRGEGKKAPRGALPRHRQTVQETTKTGKIKKIKKGVTINLNREA